MGDPTPGAGVAIRPALCRLVAPDVAARVVMPGSDVSPGPTVPDDDPLSFANVLRTPGGSAAVLDAALRRNRATLDTMVHDSVFGAPARRFAWYRLAIRGYEQTGLVAEVAVADYTRGLVLPHERTRASRQRVLAAHRRVVGTQSSPVSVAYRTNPPLAALARRGTAGTPTLAFVARDGTQHTVWVTDDPDDVAAVRSVVATIGRLYITDGHHRFAAAAAERAGLPTPPVTTPRVAPVPADHDAENWMLTALFAGDDLRISPFHRTITRPRGWSTETMLHALRAVAHVQPLPEPSVPTGASTFTMRLDDAWYEVTIGRDGRRQRMPAVAVLQDAVLAPVFGVVDPGTDRRLGYVGGDLTDLAIAVARRGAIGFAVAAPTMTDLMTAADAGMSLPPKSTRFVPKPGAGIFLRDVR